MTCVVVKTPSGSAMVCDGLGPPTVRRWPCAWCTVRGDRRLPYAIVREVFGGYCGIHYVCGRCGHAMSTSERVHDIPDNQRQINIARVRAARREEPLP